MAQGNNAFIFPGLGFGAILSGASRITDRMVTSSAYALAEYTREFHGDAGLLYPPLSELRAASLKVAEAVIRSALEEGVATEDGLEAEDLRAYVERKAWEPAYLPMVAGEDRVRDVREK